jgi:3'-phosphoadenosine 5'-phosphosulfate sulfotransferase (PAPS reductase)/FAD synthetase
MFENTGKEHPKTLEFGQRMASSWGVDIQWLEYERKYLPKYKSDERRLAGERARLACGHVYETANGRKEPGYRRVDFESAARDGEPFHNLIDLMGLPNQSTRLCTSEMKIRVAKKAMLGMGYEHWDNIIGLRADEPERVARRRGSSGNRWTDVMPLAEAGIDNDDVLEFWSKQPFDLDLPVDENGATVGGNCDLCFLKAMPKKLRLIRDDDRSVSWWEDQEARTGQTFRPHGETYRKLHLRALSDAACAVDDGLGDCFCHD